MYPIKFIPILHDKIWGGHNLSKLFNKDETNLPNIGESWEVSGHQSDPSIVENGKWSGKTLPQLVEEFKEEIVGKKIYQKYNSNFPLLFKLIDANDDLSIQVHPNDEVAKIRHNSLGKTEMWYVMHAEPNSFLTVGFKKDMTKNSYIEELENGNIEEILNKIEVKTGDVFFIPAGLVHAIGKGVMVAEIQETSDITYRIYDYKRKDNQGNERQLHTKEAVDVINYSADIKPQVNYKAEIGKSINLVDCEYFTTNVLNLESPKKNTNKEGDSFVVYMCLKGKVEVKGGTETVIVNKGETVMLPANLSEYEIIPIEKAELLEVYAN